MTTGPELHSLARVLILFGMLLLGAGVVLLLSPRIPWLGRLPGDLLIQRDRVTVYVPLASCLVASLVVTLVVWLINRFR